MKNLFSFVLVALFAGLFCNNVIAQERGEHRRGADKRSEMGERFSRLRKAVGEGKMTREDLAKKIAELRKNTGSKRGPKKGSKKGSKKPVVGCKGCKCSCHTKATKKSEKRTQGRRGGRGRGKTEGRRGRTENRPSWGGRGHTLLYKSHRS